MTPNEIAELKSYAKDLTAWGKARGLISARSELPAARETLGPVIVSTALLESGHWVARSESARASVRATEWDAVEDAGRRVLRKMAFAMGLRLRQSPLIVNVSPRLWRVSATI